MNYPKISIIMTVYNGEDFLNYSIPSVLKQTYTNIEFIVVNDGSTDNSQKILESYIDSRITILKQSNKGKNAALNLGISHAKGDYITIIDHDDYYHNSYFSNAFLDIDYLDLDVIFTDFEIIETTQTSFESKKKTIRYPIYLFDEEIFESHLSDSSIDIFLTNKIFNRNILKDFRFDENYILDDLSSSYLLLFRCNVAARVYNSIYYHVKQRESLSRKLNNSDIYVSQILDIYFNRFNFIEDSFIENKYLRKLNLDLSLLTILYSLVKLQAGNIEVDNAGLYIDMIEINIDKYLDSKRFFHKVMTRVLLFLSKKKNNSIQQSIELLIKKVIVKVNLLNKKWRAS